MRWMDPAGYELARSETVITTRDENIGDDFVLNTDGQSSYVMRAYGRARTIR